MAEATSGRCAKECGPQEIWIWSQDGKNTQVEGQHVSADFLGKHSSSVLFIYADANTIRGCPSCKAKFSDNFNIPEVWWSEYLRRGNGHFGSQDVLDDAEKVTGYVTWSLFKTKQVRSGKEEDYNWTKVNIFTQWLKSGRRVVLSFAQSKGKKKTQVAIREALLESLVARELTDPFWVYRRLLSFVLGLNDRSIWLIRDCVREIEKDDSHTTTSRPNYRKLHNLARHTIHIAEVLSVTCETIQRIKIRHGAWMTENRISDVPPEDENGSSVVPPGHAFARSVQEQLSFYEQTASSFRHRMLSTKDRLSNEINLSFNVIAQNDSRISQVDSATMKKIAFVSFVFLPATFVSAIFSTTFFNFGPDAKNWSVSDKFWVYWVVTIPITIIVPLLWRYLGVPEPKDEDGASCDVSDAKTPEPQKMDV